MASLLLTGDPNVVAAFAAGIAEGNDLYCWFSDLEPDFEFSPPLKQLDTFDDLPDTLDGIVALTVHDDGELESSLAMVYETGRPDGVPLFVNTLHTTATDIAAMVAERSPVIGIACLPGLSNFEQIIEAAPALQTSDEDAASALALLDGLFPGSVERVEDRLGLVAPRILSMIVNEAAFALMEGVAEAEDIDTAMKLGTNYPMGPLQWADAIGVDVVAELLQALFNEYGEERYRPCVLLKQYARAGKTFYPAS